MNVFSYNHSLPKTKNKRKKRILVLYDFPLKGGGSGEYAKQLALKLQRKGYEVAIALPDKNRVDLNIEQFNINLPQIPVYLGRPGLEGAKKYSDLTVAEIGEIYLAYLRDTIKIVEKFKPDFIHVHHLLINAWAADFIRGTYGIRYVVTSHGSDLYVVRKDRRYFRKTREAVRAAEAITVVSSDTREKLLAMYGREHANKTRTITGAISINKFPRNVNPEVLADLRKKYNLTKEPTVLFTGRLIDEKGVEYLVKASGRIKGQVVIAGDGPQKKKLQEMIKQKKLTNVRLTGYIDHETLIKLYYIADVFVAPSVWDDPMPLTIIEAMAAKLPVVVTRKGGIATTVKDGSTGFFVNTRNSTDIVEKVNKLLDNKSLRLKMGENAYKLVVEKFNWDKIATKFDNLFKSLNHK